MPTIWQQYKWFPINTNSVSLWTCYLLSLELK